MGGFGDFWGFLGVFEGIFFVERLGWELRGEKGIFFYFALYCFERLEVSSVSFLRSFRVVRIVGEVGKRGRWVVVGE